jgi:hypothetical protein
VATVSYRCSTHFRNNCTELECMSDAIMTATTPPKSKATPGAPEVSWAHPWRRTLELEQLAEHRRRPPV